MYTRLLRSFCKISFLLFSLPLSAEWKVEEMLKVKAISHTVPSPEGTSLLYAVNEAGKEEWTSHLYVDNKLATERIGTAPQWSLDGKSFFFISNDQLWSHSLAGEERQVLETEQDVVDFRLSPDGDGIALLLKPSKCEKRDAPFIVGAKEEGSHLYLFSLKNGGLTRLTEGDFHADSGLMTTHFTWSPDGKEIAFARMPTTQLNDWTETELWVVTVDTKRLRPLVTETLAFHPYYSPDGKWIAYVSSDRPVRWEMVFNISIIPATGGTSRRLGKTFNESAGWALGKLLGWDKEGKNVYVEENFRTRSQIYVLPLDGSPAKTLPFQKGVLSAVSFNGETFGFARQTSLSPPEAYLQKLNGDETQVSHLNAQLPLQEIAKTEVVTWKSSDNLEIEGLVTYPFLYEQGKKYPLLVVIHGGPFYFFQEAFLGNPGFYPLATFANEGFITLRCNVRGSSGYGREFRLANFRDYGGKDYEDIMTGVEALIEKGVVDAERMGVMGWSYGGFMTARITTKTHRFRAASLGAGMVDFVSMAGTTDVPDFLAVGLQKELFDDFSLYLSLSPLYYVKQVTTPTLIQFGQRDERVPLSQGYEWYQALKRQKVPVEFVIYPKMGHSFSNPSFLLDAARRNLEWFKQYLKEV